MVVAVFVGVIGAYTYTASEQRQIDARPPGSDGPTPTVAVAPAEATTTTLAELSAGAISKKVAESVWQVSTLDLQGAPVEGSSFVVGSNGGQTFLLTSLAVVGASTRVPGPSILVRSGNNQAEATLWNWDEERDLALLAISGRVPALLWASEASALRPGQKVFGVAGPSAMVTPGAVSAAVTGAIAHNVFVEAARAGGPLVNTRGEVLGVISAVYDPFNNATDQASVAIGVSLACEKVLRCGPAPTTTTKPRPTTTLRGATTTRPGGTGPATTRAPATTQPPPVLTDP
ncbi:MAG: trypsin-like peptidase domain-containing protein [Acidimicrobiales bacterium]